jgi:hypothetical protein
VQTFGSSMNVIRNRVDGDVKQFRHLGIPPSVRVHKDHTRTLHG